MTEDGLHKQPVRTVVILGACGVFLKGVPLFVWMRLPAETRNKICKRTEWLIQPFKKLFWAAYPILAIVFWPLSHLVAIVRYHFGEFRRRITNTYIHPAVSEQVRFGVRGLRNLGNTCYFNSVMQPLSHTYILHEELATGKGEVLQRSFLKSSDEVLKETSDPFSPYDVRNLFVKRVKRFNNHRQHDSHECLRHFLDEIRKEERKEKTSSGEKDLLTTVDKVFGGHLITVYNCKECDKFYHLFEPCLDLSLPVFLADDKEQIEAALIEATSPAQGLLINFEDKETPSISSPEKIRNTQNDGWENITTMDRHYEGDSRNQEIENQRRDQELSKMCTRAIRKLTNRLSQPTYRSSHKGEISLLHCLTHFTREEQIHKEYLCTDCLNEAMNRGEASDDNLKLTSATKQTLVFNPPAVLTVHFKRFELLNGRAKKRSDMVEYPEFLDIAPYCSAECLRNDPPRNNIWYSLYAVVVHSGSFLEFGHYFSYVKLRKRTENILLLEKFLQQKHFNHNVTRNDVIEMLGEKDQQLRTDLKVPIADESKWYLLNDSSVHEVEVNEVLGQEAYLLFYERLDDEEKAAAPICFSTYEKYEETDGFDGNATIEESKPLMKQN